MDSNNFVGPSGDGYDVYVNGHFVGHYPDLNTAQNAFNSAKGSSGPAPTVAATAPSAYSAGTPGAGSGVDPRAVEAAYNLANAAAQQAYNNAALELQKQNASHTWTYQNEQLAQQRAHDAWEQSIAQQGADVQQAIVTGQYNGAPTLAAQEATGYVGGVSNAATRALQMWNNLPPELRDQAHGAAIWQAVVPGMTAQQAQEMHDWGAQQARTTGNAPTDADTQMKLASMGLGQGAPTLARQQFESNASGMFNGAPTETAREFNVGQQNQTGMGLLNLASQLRGPDNAFAYANTLASVPQSMRDNLNAMMSRAGISYRGPGLGTVAGQIGSGNIYGGAGTAGDARGGGAVVPGGAAGGGDLMRGGPTYYARDAGSTTGPGATATATGATQQPQHLYQYSPTDYNATNQYVKRLMLAGLENQGNDKQAELDDYALHLPKYTGPTAGRIAA